MLNLLDEKRTLAAILFLLPYRLLLVEITVVIASVLSSKNTVQSVNPQSTKVSVAIWCQGWLHKGLTGECSEALSLEYYRERRLRGFHSSLDAR
jgi:hypothetical protein